jgi:crotonobetainyl-CoA:carnitine CoA-transferase CaiB-like acyl-CoA transferase
MSHIADKTSQSESTEESEHLPLDGLTVLELSDWIAGPYAGSLLADFGATVIMVEKPGGLSGTRQMGGMVAEDLERSPFFCVFARNKLSITLNIAETTGAETLLQLIEKSDVVICSFKPGVLDRLGLGWPVMSARNPRLILLEISGFGQTGPFHEYAGFDRVAQAFGGLTFVTGHPEMAPSRAGLTVVDYVAGLYGAFGVLLANEERRRSGIGQRIDHALYESLLPMHRDSPVHFRMNGEVKGRTGNYSPGFAPGEVFESSDGVWVHLSATGDRSFKALMVAIDQPEALDDPRFATMESRDELHEELHDRVRSWLRERSIDEIERLLLPAGVALARIQSIADMMNHPHIVERQNFQDQFHPVLGNIPAVAPIPRLSRTPGRLTSIGPTIGSDTKQVLDEFLSYSEEEILQLRAEGVI